MQTSARPAGCGPKIFHQNTTNLQGGHDLAGPARPGGEPLRIHEVRTYEDHVVLGISQPASAASLINQMTLKRAGHKTPKRRRRPRKHLGTRGKPKYGLDFLPHEHLPTRGKPKYGP